ncbi:MAG: ribosome biogenesis GTPase Der [Janthinobacterium lividum]
MAPKREIKKRMGKKHRQASTRPKLGKGPAKGARKKSGAVTGAASPKQRKQLSTKRAAEEKAKRTPTRSPEFEHRIIVGNDEESPRGKADPYAALRENKPRDDQPKGEPQATSGNDGKKDKGKGVGEKVKGEKAAAGSAKFTKEDKDSKSESKRKGRRSLPSETDAEKDDRELSSFSADLGHRRSAGSRELEGLPLVAICGRPNVGKSTLFNRLTGTRRSIVGDEPGITRDRIYGEVEWGGRTVRLVDTGGVIPDDEALIPSEIFRQARVALDEAAAIIMVIDGRTEITAADQEFSRLLIRGGKPVFLAVNKMDSAALESSAENFRTLGFRNTFPMSAEHGSGIGDILDEVWAVLPPVVEKTAETADDDKEVEAATEEPDETLGGIGDEMAEDEGDAFGDRAALVPRAMLGAMLAGEAATADEPAGVDAPEIGEPDFEAPTGGSGVEPSLEADDEETDDEAADEQAADEQEPSGTGSDRRVRSRGMAEVVENDDEDEDAPAGLDEASETPEAKRERKLRSHGEHVSRETKVAIIGRPNVGKSTLLNALTGTDRAIVSPIAGTTRDAVDEVVTRDGHDFRFIDTAGIRRKGKTKLMAEKLSVIMSRKHLEAADVSLLIIDATEGVAAADANIGGYAHESGRSVIIVVNKWDLMAPAKHQLTPDGMRPFDGKPPADKKVFEEQVRDHLKYLDYAPLVFVSAAEGKGISEVFKKVELVSRERRKRISTGNMNRFLDKVDFGRASVPMNRRVRIYYMTQAAVAPPTFVLFTDRDVKLHFSYERFLSNEIRKAFKFIGSPIWFKVKARNKKGKEA